MESSRDEDPRLTEVKAVLERLQRVSAVSKAGVENSPERGSKPSGTVLAIVGGLVAALILAAGLFVLADPSHLLGSVAGRPRQPPAQASSQPAQPAKVATPSVDLSLQPPAAGRATTPRPTLEAANSLLSAGRVQAARRQLLAIASDEAADVAWALARSYDPNFLGTLPNSDAKPDVEEAARWYRAWHAAAVKQGLVTHGVSLERIIGSMR